MRNQVERLHLSPKRELIPSFPDEDEVRLDTRVEDFSRRIEKHVVTLVADELSDRADDRQSTILRCPGRLARRDEGREVDATLDDADDVLRNVELIDERLTNHVARRDGPADHRARDRHRVGGRTCVRRDDAGLPEALHDTLREGEAAKTLNVDELGIELTQVLNQLAISERIAPRVKRLDTSLLESVELITTCRAELDLLATIVERAGEVVRVRRRVRVRELLTEKKYSQGP